MGVVIILVLNLIFGVIVDTFADLRPERQAKEETIKNSCFICGLNRKVFDNTYTTFEEHISLEHNMWHYLYFLVLLKVKDPTEFTGPESYIFKMIENRSYSWFPRMRALSLTTETTEDENSDIKLVLEKVNAAENLIEKLSKQLDKLRDMKSNRDQLKQELGLLHPGRN